MEVNLNKATMIQIVQHFFDTVLFKESTDIVTSVKANSKGAYCEEFIIKVERKDDR